MISDFRVDDLCSQNGIFIRFHSINYATIMTLSVVAYCVENGFRREALVALERSILDRFAGSEAIERLLQLNVEILAIDRETLKSLPMDRSENLCIVSSEIDLGHVGRRLWIVSFVKAKPVRDAKLRCSAKSLNRKIVLLCKEAGIACFEIRGSIALPSDCPVEVDAYRVILRYETEFGALSTKDAINALSLELGISRDEARRLLGELKYLGLIEVGKGFVRPKLL